jgi:hypothetical protein
MKHVIVRHLRGLPASRIAIAAYTPPLAVETIPSPFYSRADILPLTMDRFAPFAAIGERPSHVFSYLESRHRPVCTHREDVLRRALRQSRFMVPSPTTRRSILLIRSERSTSAALIAAIVSRNVLTFDPSDTIPPITTAIDPMAVT